MNQSVTGAFEGLQTVVAVIQRERISFLAASLAYYALISLIPLLLLVMVGTSLLGDPITIDSVIHRLQTALGEEVATLVREALTTATGRGGVTIISLLVLLWSGLKLFRGLDVAFSDVYGVPGPQSIVEQLQNATIALSAMTIAVVITVALGAVMSFLDVWAVPSGFEVELLGTLGSVVVLSIAFLPLYYLLPGPSVMVREVVPGTVLAAIGWTALQTGFRIYAGYAGAYEAYGVLGGVLLLVTWFYFGGLILLVGAVVNAVIAGRVDARPTPVSTEAQKPTAELEDIMTNERIDEGVTDAELREELERLYDELDRFEERIDDRTVHRSEIEQDLKRYTRARIRRGKARGWGPYLVLLYGTAMTLGAFFFLGGGWAILAMIVIWLSTLGLYVLMVLFGATVGAVKLPGRLRDRFESR